MEFEFEFVHRAVVKHQAVVALSQISTNRTEHKYNGDKIRVLAVLGQSREEKLQLLCSCQDYSDKTVRFELVQ